MSSEYTPPVCTRCKTLITHENASYCSNCGLELENFCTNDDCELNQDDRLESLHIHDRYCHACGSKSYYLAAGIIEDYEF